MVPCISEARSEYKVSCESAVPSSSHRGLFPLDFFTMDFSSLETWSAETITKLFESVIEPDEYPLFCPIFSFDSKAEHGIASDNAPQLSLPDANKDEQENEPFIPDLETHFVRKSANEGLGVSHPGRAAEWSLLMIEPSMKSEMTGQEFENSTPHKMSYSTASNVETDESNPVDHGVDYELATVLLSEHTSSLTNSKIAIFMDESAPIHLAHGLDESFIAIEDTRDNGDENDDMRKKLTARWDISEHKSGQDSLAVGHSLSNQGELQIEATADMISEVDAKDVYPSCRRSSGVLTVEAQELPKMPDQGIKGCIQFERLHVGPECVKQETQINDSGSIHGSQGMNSCRL